MVTKNEKYRSFRQLINAFRNTQTNQKGNPNEQVLPHTIKIEPKLIYNTYTKNLKIEFKIGNKNMYIIKNLIDFYDKMLNQEYFEYGSKLAFKHTKDAFEPESMELLDFILKYAEITKYANEVSKEYSVWQGTPINYRYILISNTGIDELFEILKNKNILWQKDGEEQTLYFDDKKPAIKFNIEKVDDEEYKIFPNIDIYEYEKIQGKEYTYFLSENVLYRCTKEYEDNELNIIEVFRKNFEKEILFSKKDLPQLFSFVFPKIKNSMEISMANQEEISEYIPQDLFVKVFLDYDNKNHIIADIKFIYGDFEFNPLLEQNVKIARDAVKEDEVLELFRRAGFMLDIKNARLILASDEAIYNFLSTEIVEFMQKFEVLATESFKTKEIRAPEIGNLGIRVENNLLKIDISNINFSVEELREIMTQYKLKKKYHRLKDGSFLQLEENETMEFINGITSQIDLDFSEIERGELKLPIYRSMYLDRLLENIKTTSIIKDDTYKNMVEKINDRKITDINLPTKLNDTLRTYQKIGIEWLTVLDSYGLGGILADDMGLGKTIQIIAIIQSYINNNSNSKPSIVICPSSLTLNWQNEINKFAPEIKSLIISGNLNERKKYIKSISKYNIVITSYDLLKRDIEFYEEQNYDFKYIIADEAQYIKNNNTQNAKAIKMINGQTRFALTGTPIENSLSELWSIFDFIMPGYLFSYKKFKEEYEIPIVKDEDKHVMKKLKMLIEPFILRRIKKEVLTELPDKTISILNNEMQEEQQKIYLSYLQSAKKEAINEINTNGFEKSQIKILALLMRLRQICCHPSLFIEDYNGESSKLNQCIELIKDAVSSGHKMLLFSGYTGMFDIIEKELKKENIKFFKLTGNTKVGERIRLVDEFNENEEVKVFLISLKAGGTGLNLTGADMVIHYDPWWNLSAENQATDRTYRIGQKKNVQVYKLITKNSIEEKIYELQQRKAKLIDNMLSTNETFINKLSKEDIMELFK